MPTITVRDIAGERQIGTDLHLDLAMPCTARDLIAAKVRAEHARVAETLGPKHAFMEKLTEALAGQMDEMVGHSLEAFGKGAFRLMLDGIEIGGLDQELALKDGSNALFIRPEPSAGAAPPGR